MNENGYYAPVVDATLQRIGQKIRMVSTKEAMPTVSTQQRSIASADISQWFWPAQGRVLNRFSTVGNNPGINIGGIEGMPIRATADGEVVYSGAGIRGYGNLIIVKHNERFLSAYAFNRRILVKEGSRVRGGQPIAEMGHDDSGRVMLHFEIRRDGNPVNPLHFLRGIG